MNLLKGVKNYPLVFLFLAVVMVPSFVSAQRVITPPLTGPITIAPPVVINPVPDMGRIIIYEDKNRDLKMITVPPPPPMLQHTPEAHPHCDERCRVICGAGDDYCWTACKRGCLE